QPRHARRQPHTVRHRDNTGAPADVSLASCLRFVNVVSGLSRDGNGPTYMSAVRDEEQLHREGAADFVAIEIVGRTPWELFWVRFKRDRVAFAALGFIVLLVLVAIFAGPISSALGHPPDA